VNPDKLVAAGLLIGIACALATLYLLLEVLAPRADRQERR
jgi:hypothetical protein